MGPMTQSPSRALSSQSCECWRRMVRHKGKERAAHRWPHPDEQLKQSSRSQALAPRSPPGSLGSIKLVDPWLMDP